MPSYITPQTSRFILHNIAHDVAALLLQAAQLQAAKAVAEVDPEAPVAITAPDGGVDIGPAGSLVQAQTPPPSPLVEASRSEQLSCDALSVYGRGV
jgi:hypothetical protein